MIYISIPVHEKPEVIVDQMHNFKKYFPEARVVLHLSSNATFSIQELEDYLKNNLVDNVHINPTQVETKWGSIIQAHLANIRYIITLNNAEKIIFHSSNDMFIRRGVFEYVKDKKYLFHIRKCTNDSLWWVARRAVKDSTIFDYFNRELYASQIEGSMYSIDILKLLINEIDNKKILLLNDIFYPREEIIFSSFMYKNNIKPNGLPYIYSEVHQFDRVFFSYLLKYKFLFSLDNFISKALKKCLEKTLIKYTKYRINKDTITKIIESDCSFQKYSYLNDNISSSWEIYNIKYLFGVKRVKRIIADPIRKFIRGLPM